MSPPVDRIPSDPELPASVDVAVIGGGIIGVAAAYHLARRGVRVALLEKGHIACEQSSRNWGWCRQQNRDERELPLVRHALQMWGELNEEIGGDTGFRRSGLIYVTKDAAELAGWEAWVTMARRHQVHSRMLTAEEAQALTPGVTERWIGGVHSPTDGRAEPAMATPALAVAARRAGATLHQGCAVRGLDTTGGAISGVFTEKGRIGAQAVLCAGGAWASLFCRRHGIRLPQAGARSTAFFTTAAPQVTDGGLSMPGAVIRRRVDGGYTVAIRNRGRLELTPQGLRYAREFWPMFRKRARGLSIGLGASFFSGPEALGTWSMDGISPFERMRVLDPAPDMAIVEEGLRSLVRAYPELAGIQASEIWGGWIDSTPDAIPVISPVEAQPGFFLATGFSGHGFGIGPAAGRLAADLVMGQAPLVDPHAFRHARLIDGSDLGPPGPM